MNELYEWMELLVMRCDLKANEVDQTNDWNTQKEGEMGERTSKRARITDYKLWLEAISTANNQSIQLQ
jgi:hypothetical protein